MIGAHGQEKCEKKSEKNQSAETHGDRLRADDPLEQATDKSRLIPKLELTC
jgi:hypothetical protein